MGGGFVPVVVSSTERAEPATLLPAQTDIEPSASGRIEITLVDGSRVTVDRIVDAATQSRVLGGSGAATIPVPSGARVWLPTGVTDMRRGMDTLALQVQ